MKAADCCLPRSQNFLNKQELNTLSELYAIDIKDCEIEVFRSFIARKGESQLNTLIGVLDVIDKDIFLDVFNIYQILVTIPQTSCKVERMFSSVKRIKTRLRSQMTTERLNHLACYLLKKILQKHFVIMM
ncbi:Zinc finger MYM-type protein 1-like [Oopsacas minuta]|uniref:Zinc finger MYM-type protein 1-like n=1 Tax=Oopsacas minuta TaxID=111878 RepID=A0AAV7KBZ8_9METZ|nr:Zinc finger MYM-type protein 1-like [Oopsacas minuta]